MKTRRTEKKRRPIDHRNWWQTTTAGRPVFECTAEAIGRKIQRIRAEHDLPLNLVREDDNDHWYLTLGKQNVLTKGRRISPTLHAFELHGWLVAYMAGFEAGTTAARERARKGRAI